MIKSKTFVRRETFSPKTQSWLCSSPWLPTVLICGYHQISLRPLIRSLDTVLERADAGLWHCLASPPSRTSMSAPQTLRLPLHDRLRTLSVCASSSGALHQCGSRRCCAFSPSPPRIVLSLAFLPSDDPGHTDNMLHRSRTVYVVYSALINR